MRSRVLVTGGMGFIGSHTCVALSDSGYTPLILDNLVNAETGVIQRLNKITGRVLRCVRGDVRDRSLLDRLFREEQIEAVIHLGGLKATSTSVSDAIACYENNVEGSLTLIEAMGAAGIKRIIFASSAAVYGSSSDNPIPETALCRPANPYGHSKRAVEQVLAALCCSYPEWGVSVLRYFNPAGAHESGLLGELPRGDAVHLISAACQVAAGQRQALMVRGCDYATRDGTAIRDYVHVMDIAQAHVLALDLMRREQGIRTFNLGAGRGFSVLDVIRAVERVSGRSVAKQYCPPRNGDVPACWADSSLALETLGWRATKTLDTICWDSWRWQVSISHGSGSSSPSVHGKIANGSPLAG